MKLLLISLVLLTTLQAQVSSQFKDVLTSQGISYNTKSILGWVRVLKKPERREQYHLDFLTQSEVNKFINELRAQYEYSAFNGKLR